MARKLSYEAWQKKAQAYAQKIELTGDDMFDESDPYDLAKEAFVAWQAGATPKAFVRDIFGEDLAERENDRQLARDG